MFNYSHGYKYAKKLLDHGAKPDYQETKYGETALMMAAANNNRKVIDILSQVSDKNIKSFNGFTAYDFALRENNIEIAKLLI